MSMFVKGTVVPALAQFEMHRKGAFYTANKKLILSAVNDVFNDVDVSWLQLASETYHISADIRDYIVTPVPIVTSDFPNRNLQGFPYEELTTFDPILGRVVYGTFKGKPTHQDHQNEDPTKAKGCIFDASFQYVPKYDVWKVIILKGWDRTKDTGLVKAIASKKRNGHSMGCLVDKFHCSICDAVVSEGEVCEHFAKGKGALIDGALAFEKCIGCNFIESSSVEDPADTSAWGVDTWGMA